MKKIYLILALLFGLGSSSFAQSSNEYDLLDDQPLITDVSQFYSPFTEPNEGSLEALLDDDASTFWHSIWSAGTVEAGTHYLQVELPDGDFDLIAFRYIRRNVTNDQITVWGIYGTNEADNDPDNPQQVGKADCELLATVETPVGNSGETIDGTPFNPQGYKYLRFYCEDSNGYVAQSTGCRGYFHIGDFQLYPAVPVDDLEAALRHLTEIINQYSVYYLAFEAGTEPGQYGEEEVNAFYAAYATASLIGDFQPGEEPTVEELEAAGEAVILTYEAVLESRVAFAGITDGYYRIHSAMIYTNNFETGEVDEDGNPLTEPRQVWKYLQINEADAVTARWSTPEPLETDATSIWKITVQGDVYDLVNVAADGVRFDDVAMSAAVTLSAESTNLMALEAIDVTPDGQTVYNIRVSTQDANNYYYLHQGGHSSGAGVSGNIVGWSSTLNNGAYGASEWIFEPVSEDIIDAALAEYAILHNHDLMVSDCKNMLADAQAKLKITKDDTKALITDVAQLSSPFTEPSEGSIPALIDGNTSTFWHSIWSGEDPVQPGDHYLQVEIVDEDVDQVYFQFTRRAVANDHITEFGVYGTNDSYAEKFDCVELATVATPFTNNTETLSSDLFSIAGYKYVRFYLNHTTNERGFGHMSEFQLYEVIDPEVSQYKVMGSIASNLEQIVNELSEVAEADLTADQYNALKEAYEAFIAKFVDPTELRDAIAAAEGRADIVVVGDQPGFWPDESCIAVLSQAIADAKTYDATCNYSPAESAAFIERLQNADQGIIEAANAIQEGKWYRIRFGTVEEFEEHGWDLVAGNAQALSDGTVTSEALFGKYVTVADLEQEDNIYTLFPAEVDKITLGKNLYLDADEDIEEKDLSLFRFVNVGDSAYALQNKFTGLFIKAAGGSGAVSLSAHPTLFNVRANGYGQNLIAAKSLLGEVQNYLHCQVASNVIVTWDASDLGSRSSLYIEEAGDVESDYDGSAFQIALEPGSLSTFCFPVEIAAEEGMYGFSSVEENKVTLAPIKKADAGRPFIFIYGDLSTYDYETEDDLSEPVAFSHGLDVVAAPQTQTALKGTFQAESVEAGTLVASGNKFVATTAASTTVGANRAYIVGEEAFAADAEITIAFGDDDNVASALANVAKSGAVYTLDGQLVSRKANLNDLKNFGRGTYILNGVKVIIK